VSKLPKNSFVNLSITLKFSVGYTITLDQESLFNDQLINLVLLLLKKYRNFLSSVLTAELVPLVVFGL
jgi:hypothetical protein